MGKTKRKRSVSYRRRQTKNRLKAKIEMTKRARKDKNTAQMPIAQRPPSPNATEPKVPRKDCSSGQVDANGERSYFPEEHARDVEDKECTNCQCLHTLLYQEQCKPRVFHSECVQCKSKRQAKTVKARQSLCYMMYSGESARSRYLYAALSAKKHKKFAILLLQRMSKPLHGCMLSLAYNNNFELRIIISYPIISSSITGAQISLHPLTNVVQQVKSGSGNLFFKATRL